MLRWLLENIGLVIFLLIFLSQILRAVLRARKAAAEHQAGRDDSAEARRVREIQEQVRRQIAARRGERAPSPPPPMPAAMEEPPVARPQTTQLPELFGGPLGRMLEELQRRNQAPSAPPPPPMVETRHTAELVRQEQLAEELRTLEEQRVLVHRRAAHLAAAKQAEAESEPKLRTAARERLLGDLRDPESLRRAFVLREVLGTPVGLR